MKKVYFTVGPSQVYPTFNKHIQNATEDNVPSLSHRGKEFKKLFQDTTDNLKKLLNIPSNYQIFFVSSALESMERIIQGCVQNYSFHLISGSFGRAWANYASQLGKKVTTVEVETTFDKEIADLEIPKKAEIICITQNDTSTGFWIPPEQIYQLKKNYPEKLIASDIVSSVPFVDIDYKYVDITFFSVQKGFGLPAGLAIIIVSPKTLQKTGTLVKKGVTVGSYHSLNNLSQKAQDFQTPETPNVLNIYLLNMVIKDMLRTGLDKIRKEIDLKAKLMYDFFDSHRIYQPFIKNPQFRSSTTLVIDVKGESEKVRDKLSKKGFLVGAGYGDNKDNQIRIANFPSHTIKNVHQMLKYV